jgi:AAA+ ATPase superfamily predicted ATPase
MKKENWEKEFDKRFEEPSGIIIGHKGVKDIKSFISQLLSLQKQEIVEEIEKEIKKTQGDLARSKRWIDEVKVKYQQYSKMFDDFKASDDGEMSAALEQYNLESGYLNALNQLTQKLTK